MGLLHCLLPYVQGIIRETEFPTVVLQKIQFSEVMLCITLHHLQGQSIQNKQLHWEARVYTLEAPMRAAKGLGMFYSWTTLTSCCIYTLINKTVTVRHNCMFIM
jgi:hypothetical protein